MARLKIEKIVKDKGLKEFGSGALWGLFVGGLIGALSSIGMALIDKIELGNINLREVLFCVIGDALIGTFIGGTSALGTYLRNKKNDNDVKTR